MNFIKKTTTEIADGRFRPVFAIAFISIGVSFFTRLALLLKSATVFSWSLYNVAGAFAIGLVFDLVAASWFIIPFVLLVWLSPDKIFRKGWFKTFLIVLFYAGIFLLLFNAVSEWFFWDEFSVRYNFIAVDYLVYTNEVLGNIWQSYPVVKILIAVAVVSVALTIWISREIGFAAARPVKLKRRTLPALLLLCIPVLSFFLVSNKWKTFSRNQYADELSGNGLYDLFSAFRNNQLDYDTFYNTINRRDAFLLMRRTLATGNSNYINDTTLERSVVNKGPEKRMNVVLISVESLSAEFLGSFGNKENLTPNLDSLAGKGVLFTNLYASGTRTVRGLESLSLSIPPTPGQSIVKRPDNAGLFSLGSIFRSKGYYTDFIYGGYGYFDNMNDFFSKNGYTVTDRRALNDNQIHYQNIWGVADEDLFTMTLHKLDQDYAGGKPFFAHVMTVSNHRPYTYPSGRIDIPSHTGRSGAVKYTDYAIGKFIREASSKPWFSNTIFVITADHCASSAGKVELPVDKYHIPLILYSPGNIAPTTFDRLTAQVDIAPTILGLLNFSYRSKFFGYDIFKLEPGRERAFISTYQSLGYIRNDTLIILKPGRKADAFVPDFKTGDARPVTASPGLIKESVAYYQMASYLYKNGLYKFTGSKASDK